jgi:hypothetical protein
MTFTDAAAEVLRLVGKPLHYKEITDIAIEKNLLSHVGKSPEVTMGARLAATLKKDSSENPLVRVKPGVFALREWDEKTIKAGLEPKKGQKKPAASAAADDADAADKGDDDEVLVSGEDDDAGQGEAMAAPVRAPRAAEPSAPARAPARVERREEGEEEEAPAPDEAMRAEAAAGAAEMFDEEEDDDQPILGGTDDRGVPVAGAAEGDGRRRRRRRRRGRSADAAPGAPGAPAPAPVVSSGGGGGLPSYTATPVFENRREGRNNDRGDRGERNDRGDRGERNDRGERGEFDRRDSGRDQGAEAGFRGPQVIELTGGEGHPLDDLAGRELADAITAILSSFDRNAGAVSLRQIAETAQRRGRLTGDPQLAQSQVAAAVRADNARRIAAGSRPRFRLAGGRVALTDWLLSGDLARLEQEALAAVERYRDGARRAFARKLGELPGHAFVEICVLALERIGVSQLRAVRRPGAPGGETHFSGILRAAADELKVAIVIRRDGREVGRERVTELRGSLHHYGPATVGWIFTAGQMLSGAREEAAIPGTPPIALYDGLAVARLCEDNDVAVIRARLPIAIPDIDLLEALRAS